MSPCMRHVTNMLSSREHCMPNFKGDAFIKLNSGFHFNYLVKFTTI